MLDNLYENIGGKIKNWAKWIFIVELIGAIISGFVLMCTDEDLRVYGLLALVCGPIVAWVSSWTLFAFGQLVEDVHAIRNKEGTTTEVNAKRESEIKAKYEAEPANSVKFHNVSIKENDIQSSTNENHNESQANVTKPKANLRKATQCECGELYYGLYCPVCGKSSKTQNATQPRSIKFTKTDETTKKSHICKCGKRFYGDACPNCGRTLKDL